jgi:hypothetical protein
MGENIKMDLKYQRKVGPELFRLRQGQVQTVVNTVMNRRAPQNKRNFFIRYGTISVSQEARVDLLVGFIR